MLTIHVECMAGDDLEQAAEEALILANKLGIGVEFNFNSVICYMPVNGDVDSLIAEWQEALKKPEGKRFAHGW